MDAHTNATHVADAPRLWQCPVSKDGFGNILICGNTPGQIRMSLDMARQLDVTLTSTLMRISASDPPAKLPATGTA